MAATTGNGGAGDVSPPLSSSQRASPFDINAYIAAAMMSTQFPSSADILSTVSAALQGSDRTPPDSPIGPHVGHGHSSIGQSPALRDPNGTEVLYSPAASASVDSPASTPPRNKGQKARQGSAAGVVKSLTYPDNDADRHVRETRTSPYVSGRQSSNIAFTPIPEYAAHNSSLSPITVPSSILSSYRTPGTEREPVIFPGPKGKVEHKRRAASHALTDARTPRTMSPGSSRREKQNSVTAASARPPSPKAKPAWIPNSGTRNARAEDAAAAAKTQTASQVVAVEKEKDMRRPPTPTAANASRKRGSSPSVTAPSRVVTPSVYDLLQESAKDRRATKQTLDDCILHLDMLKVDVRTVQEAQRALSDRFTEFQETVMSTLRQMQQQMQQQHQQNDAHMEALMQKCSREAAQPAPPPREEAAYAPRNADRSLIIAAPTVPYTSIEIPKSTGRAAPYPFSPQPMQSRGALPSPDVQMDERDLTPTHHRDPNQDWGHHRRDQTESPPRGSPTHASLEPPSPPASQRSPVAAPSSGPNSPNYIPSSHLPPPVLRSPEQPIAPSFGPTGRYQLGGTLLPMNLSSLHTIPSLAAGSNAANNPTVPPKNRPETPPQKGSQQKPKAPAKAVPRTVQ
eukprot:TRINITY_DN18668_c0_g1_i1.p1 TRINITY_DN18668_c0_g1~~TRINITY_DN18668_c0_g1_i1.p1  ORF type:complete len:641 (+),score=74.45 TRINITY_DN18668_c0_g1_i1:48-1925(+)